MGTTGKKKRRHAAAATAARKESARFRRGQDPLQQLVGTGLDRLAEDAARDGASTPGFRCYRWMGRSGWVAVTYSVEDIARCCRCAVVLLIPPNLTEAETEQLCGVVRSIAAEQQAARTAS